MTEFMQQSGEQNQAGNDDNPRDHPRTIAIDFH